RIVARRREDVRLAKEAVPFVELQAKVRHAPPAIDFVQRLRQAAPMALMAEIKRASPSKGDIAPGMNPPRQAMKYARPGAAAFSVLGDIAGVNGTLDVRRAVRVVRRQREVRRAVRRKYFVIDSDEVVEARGYGADAGLLIVACVYDEHLHGLLGLVREMGME